MDYAVKHAKALAKLQAPGGEEAIFRWEEVNPDDYNPVTDTEPAPTPHEAAGRAVEIPGDPEEYVTLELIPYQTITLIWVPNTIGVTPKIGSTIVWAGLPRTVKFHFPIRPVGQLIADRVLIG